MKIYLILIISLVFLMACGGAKSVAKTGEESSKTETGEAPQWFDPNSLEEGDIKIQKKEIEKVGEVPIAIESKPSENEIVQPKENKIVDGFRIQLSASKDSKKMRDALDSAKSVFNPRGFEVYLVYESPMYKLRVGDILDRKGADKLLGICKESGYRDAWVVPDMINSALDQGEE